jgi:hypothetical protein
MPAKVIDRIHALARRSNASNGLSFAGRHGIDPHDPADDSNDETYNPVDDTDNEDDGDALLADNIAGVNAEEIDEASNGDNQENEEVEQEASYEIEPDETEQGENAGTTKEADDNDKPMADNDEPMAPEAIDEQTTINQTMTDKYGERSEGHNLRPRRPRDYSHLHATLEGIAMTQHSVKAGLKAFGDDGAQAVVKELRQLHDREVVEPKSYDKLTRQQQHDALRYLMILK